MWIAVLRFHPGGLFFNPDFSIEKSGLNQEGVPLLLVFIGRRPLSSAKGRVE
jgi:hypothetical protein